MKNIYLALTMISVTIANCGTPTDSSDGTGKAEKTSGLPTSYIGSGDMTIAESTAAAENGSYSLTSSTKCIKDSASGTLTASFASDGETLNVRLRNFTATPKLYTCKQATNNQSSSSSLGDQFNGCGISFSVDSSESYAANQYATFRENLNVPPFSHSGECTIDVSESSQDFRATVQCTKLIQTHYDGSPRNPIDIAAMANVQASVSCEIFVN